MICMYLPHFQYYRPGQCLLRYPTLRFHNPFFHFIQNITPFRAQTLDIAQISLVSIMTDSYHSASTSLANTFIELATPPETLTLSLEELLTACRNEKDIQEGIEEEVANDFSLIQQQIFEVVSMRKNMEKILQIEALQFQHFSALKGLVEQNLALQETTDQTAISLKRMESQQIEKVLKLYSSHYRPHHFQEVIKAAVTAKLELQDIERVMCVFPLEGKMSENQYEENWATDSYNCVTEQKQPDQLALSKQVYRQLFQDLSLREQLVEERERFFEDYQASSHQLVESLLSQREKDHNLQRAEHEKHEQLLLVRHRFDIELEKLSHHQSNLVSLYEIDLLALKKKASQAELHLEQSNHQIQSLEQELFICKKDLFDFKAKYQTSQEERVKMKELLESAQIEGKRLQKNKQSFNQELVLLQQKETELLKEVCLLKQREENLRGELSAKSLQNQQLSNRTDVLQSQLNETILRSSQANKTKQELTRKLENNVKQLQTKNQILFEEQRANRALENNIALECKRTRELLEQLEMSRCEGDLLKEQVKLLNKKLEELQNDQTSAKRELLRILQEKDDQCIRLKLGERLTESDWEEVREEVETEMKKQMKYAVRTVDEFIQRMAQYCQTDW